MEAKRQKGSMSFSPSSSQYQDKTYDGIMENADDGLMKYTKLGKKCLKQEMVLLERLRKVFFFLLPEKKREKSCPLSFETQKVLFSSCTPQKDAP